MNSSFGNLGFRINIALHNAIPHFGIGLFRYGGTLQCPPAGNEGNESNADRLVHYASPQTSIRSCRKPIPALSLFHFFKSHGIRQITETKMPCPGGAAVTTAATNSAGCVFESRWRIFFYFRFFNSNLLQFDFLIVIYSKVKIASNGADTP